MRLAVIGTSNSLMKNGYRTFLEAFGTVEVTNFALGGTPNVLLPYRVPGIDWGLFDSVLIDTMVNDLWCTSAGAFDPWRAKQVLAETMAHLTWQGVRIVLLLMPTSDPRLDHVTLRAEYVAIAAAYGAAVIDGYEVSQALLEHGVPESIVFIDPGHLSPQSSMIIAQRVADALLTLGERRVGHALGTADYPHEVHPADAAELPAVSRRTSAIQGRYVQIASGQAVCFTFEEPRELVALSLNEARTSAIVEIRTEQSLVTKDLRFSKSADPPLRHSLTPMLIMPAGREIVIRVLVSDESGAGLPEKSSHSLGGMAAGMLELEGIVTRRQTVPPATLPMDVPPLRSARPMSRWETGLATLMMIDGHRIAESDLVGHFRSLFGSPRDFNGYEVADLLRDIGRLAIAAGDSQTARNALSLALRQRPGGVFIQQLLEGLRPSGLATKDMSEDRLARQHLGGGVVRH